MTTYHAVSDPTRLAPEDALHTRPVAPATTGDADSTTTNSPGAQRNVTARRTRDQRHNRSRSHKRKGQWKKLLWVRQSYPDNYTDEETFLDALQRNPRLRPYEFWPLVADSTVIVQQICTMIVFVCCFSGIIRERVSPVTVVTLGTIGTVLGWLLWDSWVGQELALNATVEVKQQHVLDSDGGTTPISRSVSQRDLHSLTSQSSVRSFSSKDLLGLGIQASRSPSHTDLHAAALGLHSRAVSQTSLSSNFANNHLSSHSRRTSTASFKLTPISEPTTHHRPAHQSAARPPLSRSNSAATSPTSPASAKSYSYYPPLGDPDSRLSPRNQQRLATAKSALLIYCALLGLSPILKSLTKSTASDSIWAIAFWLMCTNVVTFDYGSGVGPTFPASLSTNAALMASTVLASRLPSTTHVFSLTLFSIEVFGLFPVFRRYLRHISWLGHLALTWFLVMAAGGGVASVVSGGGWKAAVGGVIGGSLVAGLAMGLCSWWLIGLQRYKNEIYGPWDPARPVIRRWD